MELVVALSLLAVLAVLIHRRLLPGSRTDREPVNPIQAEEGSTVPDEDRLDADQRGKQEDAPEPVQEPGVDGEKQSDTGPLGITGTEGETVEKSVEIQGTEPAEVTSSIPPSRRGGRPREKARCVRSRRNTRLVLPEVFCERRGLTWVVGMEKENGRRDCKQWDELPAKDRIRPYLVFKLRRDGLFGHLVSRTSGEGLYLSVFPERWVLQSDGKLQSVRNTSIEGYVAGLLQMYGTGDAYLLRATDGTEIPFETIKAQLALSGKVYDDGLAGVFGPLFLGAPPTIVPVRDKALEQVKTLVVGREGSGRGRWRTYCQPDTSGEEILLPAELAKRKSGWYFVRIYNHLDELLESFDFRFVTSVKSIDIQPHSALPGPSGHSDVRVRILHDGGVLIYPRDDRIGSLVRVVRDGEYLLPPDPQCDLTLWDVREAPGGPIPLRLVLNRIWWGLGTEGTAPIEWVDKEIRIERAWFKATSSSCLWVKVPDADRQGVVLAGFDRTAARPYRGNKGMIPVPLRDFGDSPVLAGQLGPASFKLWAPEARGECMAAVARVMDRYMCMMPGCSYMTGDEYDMARHLLKRHLPELFRHPETLSEYAAEVDFQIPKLILVCTFCGTYLLDYGINGDGTSTMTSHAEECKEREGRNAMTAFRSIHRVQDIEGYLSERFPELYICRQCGERLEFKKGKDPEWDLCTHLISRHKKDLYASG
ncbi:MAG: hypothetical protein AB1497_10595 [Bacillota bacterium]